MKKLITLFITVTLLLSLAITGAEAATDEKPSLLVDDYSLLTDEQSKELLSSLETVSDKYNFDVVIWTIEDYTAWSGVFSNKTISMESLSDDIFDYCGYGRGSNYDGCILLISMKDRSWHISTSGYGKTVFTDAGLRYIEDEIVPYLSENDYNGGLTCFASLCDDYLRQAATGSPYDSGSLPSQSNESSEKSFNVVPSLLFSVIIGLIAATIVVLIMRGKLKTVHYNYSASDYVRAGSLNIVKSRDLFLYSHIDRRKKPEKTSSSSGTSSHTSSSGRSHGGRGGHF